MKRKQLLSWMLSLVMALTVFAIPTGIFAGEDNEGGVDTSARQLCWCFGEYSGYSPVKQKPTFYGTFLDENTGVIHVCKWKEYEPDQYEWQTDWSAKYIKWTSDKPEVAGLFTFGEGTGGEATSYGDPEALIAPRSQGTATITAELYDENDQLIDSLAVEITVTQEAVDAVNAIKYHDYLYDDPGVSLADVDYDDRQVRIELPWLKSFNQWMRETGLPELTNAERDGLEISVKVGSQSFMKKGSDADKYDEISVPFSKVTPGTTVTATLKLGNVTRYINTMVTRWIDPKVTAKNIEYDGKGHLAPVSVKYGKETISSKSYYVNKNSRKAVGTWKYTVQNRSTSKYKFYCEGYFKINPKGTSLKKLKSAKKAFTVTWAKQAKKMSKSRITGYQIQYSTSSKFTKKTTKTVTVKGYSTTSKKIKKLKKKKTYYVRVRTYMKNGKSTCYSKWSKVKTVKTK